MEQSSIKFALSIRSAAARRVVCGCHAGGGRAAAEGAQDGALGVQSLLPGAVCKSSR